MAATAKRCAIYARKSSEEGLEQSFNSLHAQREACAAYVNSQRHEGWRALDKLYDDGGYSGGSMDRPGLQALLADIAQGKVDVVVVYKVDRLTRALSDFAKIVEIFDQHNVSFVSVTQHFNTTTSMGRLTLNVLLSFAQFEREVTGERIRDKIAASKKKGIWMGGYVPLGYDLNERRLTPNVGEAALVTRMFERYLGLGCVDKLQRELKAAGVLSKVRKGRDGRTTGGVPYSRGALYSILQNRLYLGEIEHKGAVYPGQHDALIPLELWNKVRHRLKTNSTARKLGIDAKSPSLLAGLFFDPDGYRFTPLHSTKAGKRYRYYTSQAVIRNGPGKERLGVRVPAHDVEKLVIAQLRQFLQSGPELLQAISAADSARTQQSILRAAGEQAEALGSGTESARGVLCAIDAKIVLSDTQVAIQIDLPKLRDRLGLEASADDETQTTTVVAPASIKRLGGTVRLVVPSEDVRDAAPQANEVLVKAIARGWHWYNQLASGEVESVQALAKQTGLNASYISRVLRCAFLSPRLVEDILDGRHPKALSLDALFDGIPHSWSEQHRAYASYVV